MMESYVFYNRILAVNYVNQHAIILTTDYKILKVKVKQSHYRPGQAQRVPGG